MRSVIPPLPPLQPAVGTTSPLNSLMKHHDAKDHSTSMPYPTSAFNLNISVPDAVVSASILTGLRLRPLCVEEQRQSELAITDYVDVVDDGNSLPLAAGCDDSSDIETPNLGNIDGESISSSFSDGSHSPTINGTNWLPALDGCEEEGQEDDKLRTEEASAVKEEKSEILNHLCAENNDALLDRINFKNEQLRSCHAEQEAQPKHPRKQYSSETKQSELVSRSSRTNTVVQRNRINSINSNNNSRRKSNSLSFSVSAKAAGAATRSGGVADGAECKNKNNVAVVAERELTRDKKALNNTSTSSSSSKPDANVIRYSDIEHDNEKLDTKEVSASNAVNIIVKPDNATSRPYNYINTKKGDPTSVSPLKKRGPITNYPTESGPKKSRNPDNSALSSSVIPQSAEKRAISFSDFHYHGNGVGSVVGTSTSTMKRNSALMIGSSAEKSAPSVATTMRYLKSKKERALLEAKKANCKAFTLVGPYADVREALLKRGYVENRKLGVPSDFNWTCKRDEINVKDLSKDQVHNHFAKASEVTTKVGLWRNLKNVPWCVSEDADTFFPRSHHLNSEDGFDDFLDDFRDGTAIGILRMVIEEKRNDIPMSIIQLCVKAINFRLSERRHEDIDCGGSVSLTPQQWHSVLQAFLTIREREKMELRMSLYDCSKAAKKSSPPSLSIEKVVFEEEFLSILHNTLDEIRPLRPQFFIEGSRNIWIIKPAAKSRGRGIFCTDRVDDVISLLATDECRMHKEQWMAQKYIERPLLVHRHKFDIRQWVLVTDWNPLTVWFYDDCYLRFSTDEYSLHDLNESIHLTNNSIQKKIVGFGDLSFADGNMWSRRQFKNWLNNDLGVRGAYDEIIDPRMREICTVTFQAVQDQMERRKNSFELYGVDFVLDEQLTPWLLEINSSPCLSSTTSITSILCPAVIEDTLRVVLDRRTDRNAAVGKWELIHRQPINSVPVSSFGLSLDIIGKTARLYNSSRKSATTRVGTVTADSAEGQKQSKTNNTSSVSTPSDSTDSSSCDEVKEASSMIETPRNEGNNTEDDNTTDAVDEFCDFFTPAKSSLTPSTSKRHVKSRERTPIPVSMATPKIAPMVGTTVKQQGFSGRNSVHISTANLNRTKGNTEGHRAPSSLSTSPRMWNPMQALINDEQSQLPRISKSDNGE